MFGTFSGLLSFACAISLVCILGAGNHAFAQNVGSEYDIFGGVDINDDAIIRTKRATYGTFVLAHVIDPTTTRSLTSQAKWMKFYRDRSAKFSAGYSRDYPGKRPPRALTQKNVNTMIIADLFSIENAFTEHGVTDGNAKRQNKQNLKWSNKKYNVVIYTSNNGKNPKFFKCPDKLYALAALDKDGHPMHLETACHFKQQRGNPRLCYPVTNCVEIGKELQTANSKKNQKMKKSGKRRH